MSVRFLPPSDSFVGRATDLDALGPALRSSRIVTIAGPAGVGKTRLALELLLRQRSLRPPRSVTPVDLASTTDGRGVVGAFADALEVRVNAREDVLGALAGAIGKQRLLLFVDNCAHVVGQAAALIAALLERCPDLRVLATSRETLRVPGELVHWLGPLPEQDCRTLLLDRVGAVELTDEQELLCRQLEGMPLAVELAAKRVGSAAPAEIADAVYADLTPAIEWSYRLLSTREQAVLRRLSVCEGGFGIVAARHVCADDSVLPVVLNLCTKSLLQSDVTANTTRFHMLDSVRRFTFAELSSRADELADAHTRLVRWLVDLAAPLRARMRPRHGMVGCLKDAEAGHFAVALRHLEDKPDPEDHRTLLACALARTWHFRGHIHRAVHLLSTALAAGPDSPHRVAALIYLSWFSGMLGRHSTALAYAVEAVTGAVDSALRVRALARVGDALLTCGRAATGVLVHRMSLALAEASGAAFSVTGCRQNLAWTLLSAGELAEARELANVALAEHRALVDPAEHGTVLHTSAAIHLALGDHVAAGHDLEEALRVAPEDGYNFAYVLEGLAIIARRLGDPVRCATLLAAASADRARVRLVPAPLWQEWVDGAREWLATALSNRQITAAAEHGRELSHGDLIRLALTPTMPAGTQLTVRQQQVVALLADGMSNQDISERLGIAISTVNNRVDQIKQRLGLYSRAELIAWHIERGSRRATG